MVDFSTFNGPASNKMRENGGSEKINIGNSVIQKKGEMEGEITEEAVKGRCYRVMNMAESLRITFSISGGCSAAIPTATLFVI